MTSPITYLGIHLLFVLPPIAVLLVLATVRSDAWLDRDAVVGLVVIVCLALLYTTPWDNYLIDAGVWWYGDGATAATIWSAPVGEYLFFVLQPILTALVLYQFVVPTAERVGMSLRHRVVGLFAGAAITIVGVALVVGPASTLYLGAILAWGGPILAIQWGFGATFLWRVRRPLIAAVAIPTLYLWIVDWIAISLGVWTISETYTTGLGVAGLPLEEAAFFLVTNVFVVQGLVLYRWLVDAWPYPIEDFLPASIGSRSLPGGGK